jgi:hypothetical protein
MEIAAIAMTLALAGGGTDQAQQIRQPARTVYVCDRDRVSERAFERAHRTEMKFVTADEVLRSDERWTAPRCVSEREGRKLEAELARRSGPQRHAARD